MAFVEVVERVVQDSANVVTTSGLSLVKITPTLSPSSLIREGNEKLIAVGDCLRSTRLPEDVEKPLFLKQDVLLNEARRLLSEKSRLGFLKQVILIRRAMSFRDDALHLHSEVMLASEFYRVRRYLQYSLSTHSLNSWENVAPPSPQVTPADTDAACQLSQVPTLPEGQGGHEVESFKLHAPSCNCTAAPPDTSMFTSVTGSQLSAAASEGS